MLKNKRTFYLILFLLAVGTGTLILFLETGGVDHKLWHDVADLNLGWKGYTVGHKLSQKQWSIAEKNQEQGAYPGTIKFKEDDLFVVADKSSHRVIVAYEHHEKITSDELKGLIGSLMLAFQEPTTLAHGKTLYWAYGPKGKMDEMTFQQLTEAETKPVILITVKLHSSQPIAAITGAGSTMTDVYLIVSSGPILEQLHP